MEHLFQFPLSYISTVRMEESVFNHQPWTYFFSGHQLGEISLISVIPRKRTEVGTCWLTGWKHLILILKSHFPSICWASLLLKWLLIGIFPFLIYVLYLSPKDLYGHGNMNDKALIFVLTWLLLTSYCFISIKFYVIIILCWITAMFLTI